MRWSRLCHSSLVALGFFVSLATPAVGQTPLSQRIDQLVAARKDNAKFAAAPASDAEFVRRIYLDLTGVIPTAAETRAFLADKSPERRAKLIDKLLASDGYVRHMQVTFDVLLLDRRPDKLVKRGDWLEFLRATFAENKPYDQFIAAMLSADGSDVKNRGPAAFLLNRDAEPHQATKDISRLFLGMNLQCAQCHDHPLVDAYKQDYYYGIYAFLNRTMVFADKATKVSILAEKAEGDVTFQSVFVKVTRSTPPRMPDGKPLEEPKFPKGQEYVKPFKAGEKPEPKFSRRVHLAKELIDSPRFRRAAANRLWYMMLGRGIVHPVDYDHPANPPSHPELLTLLGDEFAAMKYDMKAFLKQIALSQTYQRSSELPKGVKDVPPDMFAVYPLRPLTPEQLARSMMQATGLVDAERAANPKLNESAVYAKLATPIQTFVNLFGSQPGEPFSPDNFEATLTQTLFLQNGQLLRDWLAPKNGNLTDRLGKLQDPGAVADELFVSMLTRLPSAEEKKDVADFLASRQNDRPAALQDLAWALLTSAEFRFNH